MYVLGIESTCDETACAVVQDGKKILSNVVSSQIDLHKEYGGVVPELACRRHVDVMLPVIQEALTLSGVSQVDLIAVAKGPGLIGALLLGMHAAKGLAMAWNKPLIGVNHIEAHLYASMMEQDISFPALGVVISGGHTAIVKITSLGSYELIGQTVDDAIGEAFDKAAKILHLPYPGGPEIELLAKNGDASIHPLKAGNVKGRPLDFSFSGLKTGVLYASKNYFKPEDLAASFQQAALMDIIKKTKLAAAETGCKTVVFGGGVSNNQTLRHLFATKTSLQCFWPPTGLSLDNAAMIAGLGYHTFLKEGPSPIDLEPMTSISF